jgi:hypothetical protein
MDWEELRVRAQQEIRKRSDLLMHQLGLRNGILCSPFDLSAPSRNFFFPMGNSVERANLLRTHLPDEALEIVRQSDEICDHRFRLLGYENLVFAPKRGETDSSNNEKDKNKDIDWHLDPVHGQRAPLNAWFKIPFLDFAIVGDHKVTWELNRHQHLVTLAKARLLSGDEKYTRELISQWRSWIKANPYPLGINWGSTLEVAFRSLSWIWIDHLLAGLPECAEFRAELMPTLAFHGRYIERYLSTYFSPNTHLLGEAVALFFLGTLYPQMPGAARWRQSGWNIVLHEAERQVRPDGVYFEQSLYYHVYALDFFLYARLLAARNAMAIPHSFDTVLQKMLEVIAALAQAGPAEGFGDDDGGRVLIPRRNRTEHMTDPLALGAVMYSRQFPAARLTEEAIWLFGPEAVEKFTPAEKIAPTNVGTHSVAFPDGGIYVLADSKPYSQAMQVDAGPQGVGRSGHGHADALSLRLTMDGRRWLVDSGSGVYISKDPLDRNTFRGTAAHSTLQVDGVDQAIPDQPFSWTNIPTAKAEEWLVGKTFVYFVGSHNGYSRLADPVLHQRHVMKIAGDLFLVRDVALGHAEHQLEIRWHFASDLEVHPVTPRRVEISAAASSCKLSLIIPEDTAWQMDVGSTQLSPAYGALQTAPVVRCRARVSLPSEIATLLAPSSKTTHSVESLIESRLLSRAQPSVHSYEFHRADGTHRFAFALGAEAWTSGPFTSDVRVLYCRIQKDKLAQLVAIGGTYLHWHDQPLLESRGASAFFEWERSNAVPNKVAETFSTSPLFEELAAGISVSAAKPNHTSLNSSSSTFAEK